MTVREGKGEGREGKILIFGFAFLLLSPLALRPFARADDAQDLSLIDPEFSNTPLPKLTLPPEPPPGITLPETIAKSDEWKGVQCGVQDARVAVFQHGDKWTDFWQKAMAPYSARFTSVPAVDFAKDMVVGVFLGEKRTPNYEIDIRSIRPEPREGGETVLVIRYRQVTKMSGVFVPPFAVQPFHLKKIPTFTGRVVFTQVRR